jgi:hypothetical protein
VTTSIGAGLRAARQTARDGAQRSAAQRSAAQRSAAQRSSGSFARVGMDT